MREGWTTTTIGAIADITDYVANGSFATLRENVSYRNTKDYAVLVRLADFSNGFDESKFIYIDKHAYDFLSKSKLFGGEIIMSNVGSLGKMFICPDLGMPMSLAPNSIVIKTENNKFYYYLLSSRHYQSLILSISSTTALPKFNKTSFKKVPIEIPQFNEQERIVAELDLLTGIIDKQKAQLQELDTLAQSIFYDMFGDPESNEKGWSMKALMDVCARITDGSHFSPKEDEKGIYPMLSVKDMDPNGFNYDKCKYINKSDYLGLVANGCKPSVNDVLVAKDGSYLKTAFVQREDREQTILSSIAILTPRLDVVNPEYLSFFFKIPFTKSLVEKHYLTGTAIKRVILKGFKVIQIPLPPLGIQEKFAQKIQSIESQKASINQSIAETQKLFDYTMDKYFG